MAAQSFDALSEAYEAMITWPRRLANEEPFYRWLFDRICARRVLDAACGTGHHAAMFHDWGLQVEGADLSPTMIDRCRKAFGESDSLRWAVRGFDQPVPQPGTFDVAICVGNSLALADDAATIDRALRQLLSAVRPGGALVIHVINLWALDDGPTQWQKCTLADLSRGQSLITKGIHRCGSRGYVDVLVTQLAGDSPVLHSDCVRFWGLEAEELTRIVRAAGASQVEFYGSYPRRPYDRLKSQDLLMVAVR